MLGPFLDLLEETPALLDDIASLRLVFCSGEALTPAQVNRFNRIFAVAGAAAPRLVNLYGPTEATVAVSVGRCYPDRPVTIGKPIPGVTVRIIRVDDDGHPAGLAAPDQVGELWVGGAGVARGYLDRPDDPAFVVDPDGSRWYRTGDLATQSADGTLTFRGRIDRQIKLNGYRIQPEEVEAALRAHPAVLDALVTAENGRLVATVEANRPWPNPGGVILQVALTCQPHMVPSAVRIVDRLPRGVTGKLDTRAEPTPAGHLPSAARPGGGVAETVAATVAGLLGGDDPDTSFLDLPGYSSLALPALAVRLTEQLGRPVSVLDVAGNPTITKLTAALDHPPASR
jgi:acyl-CoA synthetase (AMP-forming)/AMP-acid ligase II